VNKVSRQWEPAPALTLGAQHRPLRVAVLDALRASIIDGTYRPGDRLVEEEIASRFAVSRNPIRDALHALASEGFVELEPRRGGRVATVDAARARALFELRAPLEALVAKLAAERRTADELAELRATVARGHRAVEAGRLDELPALNTEFHRLLAVAARNEFLADTLARLSHIIRWVYAARISQRSSRSWDEHAAILDAVAAQDPERAAACGFDHIASAAAVYAG
jgi:DNA-binding GntR family transcriptional regulator